MSDQAEAQSVEDKMMALLGDDGKFLEDKEPIEAEDVEAAQVEQEQETEEVEESEEDKPEPRMFKLKRGEEEVEVPEEEVIELAQKGRDYTVKTQALAEERKSVEERAQAITAQETYLHQQTELQQVLIKDIAKVEALNDQIAEYDKLNWQEMSDQDPVQAQKLFFQYTQLTNKRNNSIQELNQKQGQATALRQQKMQQMAAEGYKQLSKDIPDWSNEKALELRKAAKNYGYSDQEMENVYDPRFVRLIHDAAQFRALKQNQSTVANKVANKPPVVKQGGKNAGVVNRSQNTQLREKLRQTGDQNVAAKLIESML